MDTQQLATTVLGALAQAQIEGQFVDLERLSTQLALPRTVVRSVVTALDRAGLVQAGRMRLTLRGFAVSQRLAVQTQTAPSPNRAERKSRSA
jgi:DNA-binding IclR family transcriptional regulator